MKTVEMRRRILLSAKGESQAELDLGIIVCIRHC